MIVESQGLGLHRIFSAGAWLRYWARVTLLLPLVLLGCSSVALPQTDAPPAEANPAAFHKIIGDYFKKTFKEIAMYQNFEISDARWVHAVKGWSWLSCIRFQERGHVRTYAVFIQTDKVVDNRYAVTTDRCSEQTYTPFDEISVELDPLH